MTEAKLALKTKKALAGEPYTLVNKIHGSGQQKRGMSDILGCHRRHYFAIEMKLPGKEKSLTPLQAKFIRDVRKAGGRAGVASNIRMALEIMKGESYGYGGKAFAESA